MAGGSKRHAQCHGGEEAAAEGTAETEGAGREGNGARTGDGRGGRRRWEASEEHADRMDEAAYAKSAEGECGRERTAAGGKCASGEEGSARSAGQPQSRQRAPWEAVAQGSESEREQRAADRGQNEVDRG